VAGHPQFADRVAAVLAAEGVEFIVGFPENRLLNAAALAGIRPIIARTERVAINIADGFTRVTAGRRIAACAVQHGPGTEAALAAVAQAYGDRTPLLILPGAYERSDQHIEANFDAAAVYAHVTGWATTLNDPRNASEVLRHAFGLLRGRPTTGPVLVAIATDLLWEEAPEEIPSYERAAPRRSAAAPQDVAETAEIIAAAADPVFLAGSGVLYAEASDELRELAELCAIPVATTLNGKSAFPEDHPLALGAAGKTYPATVDHFLEAADVIVGIGTSLTRSAYLRPLPAGARIGQITDDARDVGRNYDVSFGATGDAKLVLRQLIDELRRRHPDGLRRDRDGATRATIQRLRESFRAAWDERLRCDTAPISPYRVIAELMDTVDRTRTVVTHDAGNPRDQMMPFYESVVPHGYIGWGKTTQLGTGLGLAMGARLARPDWLAVNVMGDAAFGMVGMDFETAVRCELPILTIVMNNGVMGGYMQYMPDAIERYGANRTSGDYAAVARALGGHGERVADPADLRAALERGIASVEAGTAALVEVLTREEPVFAMG
jgi:thiamine pyrophosphate-dependent acetolactate synthase large subunit-like protein